MEVNNNHAELFLDSVIYEEIAKYAWIISGVTTTPTFFKRDQVNFDGFASQLRAEYPYLELHVEALGINPIETEKELLKILNKPWFNKNKVVIKIPVSFDNLKIVSKYTKKSIKFNTHLVFTSSQAYLSVLAGTAYVCPLIGRYADNMSSLFAKNLHGGDSDMAKKLLEEIIQTVKTADQKKNVYTMASSIRTVGDFYNAISAGADVITVPTKVLEESLKNEYTDEGVATLLASLKLAPNGKNNPKK